MANDITIRTNLTFKNERLNAITQDMAQNAAAAVDNVKQICIDLSIIEAGLLYKDDGFKNLAEYAETIGLDKSKAHKMENAGRLYTSANEKIRLLAAGMDWSKAAMLASEDESDIDAGINSNELTSDMTQEAVRKWKDRRKAAKESKGKVLKRYNYAGLYIPVSGAQMVIAETCTRESFLENWVKGAEYDKKTASIAAEGKTPVSRTIILDENGNIIIYRESPVVEAKGKGKGPSDKDMAKLIAKYRAALAALGVDPDAKDAAEDAAEDDGSDANIDLQQDLWDYDGI